MVFAVASKDSIFIYDTEQSVPISVITGIHFAAITDLSWSKDGSTLSISSYDGFCSIIDFDVQKVFGESLPITEQNSIIQKNRYIFEEKENIPKNTVNKDLGINVTDNNPNIIPN